MNNSYLSFHDRARKNEVILLAHGSGGKLSHDLVEKKFSPFPG